MKYVIAFAALVAVCAALPAAPLGSPSGGPDAAATSVRDARSNDGINGYQFDYETSNGISRQESGQLKPVGETGVIVSNGEASWTSPEGVAVSFKFVADENGYQPIIA